MKLSYVNFTKLSETELLQILKWRNSDEVRLNLKQQNIISEAEHLRFCHSLIHRPELKYYQVSLNDTVCGVVTFTDLDFGKSSGEYGLYTVSLQPGAGMLMAKSALYIFFNIFKLQTLNIEVLDFNQHALKFNEECLGFKHPRYQKDACEISGKRIGIYSYVMTMPEWESQIAPSDLKLLSRLTLEFEGIILPIVQ